MGVVEALQLCTLAFIGATWAELRDLRKTSSANGERLATLEGIEKGKQLTDS
jgi:hypothetical protein